MEQDTLTNNSLITADEAESVIKNEGGALVVHRLPLMIITGTITVISLTLVVMIVLSVTGTKTGLGAVLPFLEKPNNQNLILN
jgi:hypothetical protein